MSQFQAAYIETHRSGRLWEKLEAAREALDCCELCPRRCRVDRNRNETGVCKTGRTAFVASYDAHFGEESPLVGRHGSGTIFFTHCNMRCCFCQNFDISHKGVGRSTSDERLASYMLELQNAGCHNINFVSPSHVVPQILSAVSMAVERGLTVPLVYNSGGYDRVETLALLEGVIDIYMPDFKFWDPEIAQKACDARDYPEVARSALIEMHRQVGDLTIDANGIASRGMLIRHLVLPDETAGTGHIMDFIAEKISKNTYVNLMSQYRPCGEADRLPSLMKRPSQKEIQKAFAQARSAGLTRLDKPRRTFLVY